MTTPRELVLRGPLPLRGRLRVPGCKGISHRALLFAAMADGVSAIGGLATGDDVARTRAALEGLGVTLRDGDDGILSVRGHGVAGLREPTAVLDCGNSGTTMRMVAGLVAGRGFHCVLSGDASLAQRPMGRVVAPLRAMGASIDGRENATLPPLAIRGGGLAAVVADLPVPTGQVKTALLLAGLQAAGTTEIVEPAPSRDHSERILAALGAPVEVVSDRVVRVGSGAPAPFDLEIPGDASSAAFFVVAALITPDSQIVLEGVSVNPRRVEFLAVLRRMGAHIVVHPRGDRLGEPVGDIEVTASPLTGTIIECEEGMIDEVPVLAIAGAFAEGVTEIRNAAELRVKESDRIATLEAEITRLGVGVESLADGLVIRGGQPRPATFESHGDHRIALAAAVAANALEGESVVRGWPAVRVSYPEFEQHLASLTGPPN